MKGIILGFINAFVAHGAQAADMSLSVNLGGVMDLPDKVSAEHTKFNVGPALGVTYRLHFTQAARLRWACTAMLRRVLTACLGNLKLMEESPGVRR